MLRVSETGHLEMGSEAVSDGEEILKTEIFEIGVLTKTDGKIGEEEVVE